MFEEEQALHGDAAISWIAYLREADFWNRTLQNWQSEFLAVATMAAFSIYLRQRGSPGFSHSPSTHKCPSRVQPTRAVESPEALPSNARTTRSRG